MIMINNDVINAFRFEAEAVGPRCQLPINEALHAPRAEGVRSATTWVMREIGQEELAHVL